MGVRKASEVGELMVKSNIHKKLYSENKFERSYCLERHRLAILRDDKHRESKAWRAFLKKEEAKDE